MSYKNVGYFYIALGNTHDNDFLLDVFYFNDFSVQLALYDDHITPNVTDISGYSGYYVNQLLDSDNKLLLSNIGTSKSLLNTCVTVISDDTQSYKYTTVNGLRVRLGDTLYFNEDGTLTKVTVDPDEPDEPVDPDEPDVPTGKTYLDLAGLTAYHNKVVSALNDKSNKDHDHDEKYSDIKHDHDDIYQNILVSGLNIKTVNGYTLLGSGDIEITGGSGGSGGKPYIGPTEPTESEVWLDTSNDENNSEVQEVSTYSLRRTLVREETSSNDEVLIFNEDLDDEELIFND